MTFFKSLQFANTEVVIYYSLPHQRHSVTSHQVPRMSHLDASHSEPICVLTFVNPKHSLLAIQGVCISIALVKIKGGCIQLVQAGEEPYMLLKIWVSH